MFFWLHACGNTTAPSFSSSIGVRSCHPAAVIPSVLAENYMLNAFVPWLAAIIPPSLFLVSLWGRFKLSENWNRWDSRTEPCILESMRVSKSWWEKETNWCFRNVFTGRCCGAPTAVQLLNNVHIIIIMNSWMKPNAAFFLSLLVLQHSSTGHLQCYHSHGSINNAVAARSMWVTIRKLFSCRSTFPDLLFSAAQTQTTQLFTYCCQSHWDTQKWWLHLPVCLRG